MTAPDSQGDPYGCVGLIRYEIDRDEGFADVALKFTRIRIATEREEIERMVLRAFWFVFDKCVDEDSNDDEGWVDEEDA